MEDIKELMQSAHDLFMEEKFSEAEEKYRILLYERMIDGEDRILVELEYSWLLYKQKRIDEALAILLKLKDNPGLKKQHQFDTFRLIGFSYAIKGDRVNAIQYLQEALNAEIPENEKRFIYYELGRLHFLQGEYSDALQHFSRAIRFFSDDDEYYYAIRYYLGFLYLFQDNVEDAFEEFSFLIENAPQEDKVIGGMYGMAQVFMKQANYENVIKTCKDILNINPNFEDKETIAYMLVRSYYELQDWDNFALFYREMKSQYPNSMYREIYPLFDKKMEELKSQKD